MWDENPYQTMSIATPGPATLPKSEARRFAAKNTNDISDIDGAHSGPKYKLYTNKPQFSQADIPGSTSKQLCRSRNTRDNTLYIDDIEGTRKLIKDRMMRTNRHVNPLEPQYSLPSYTPIEHPEPRFVRDAVDVSDIEGTKPRIKKELQTRDIMAINDIEGAKPGLKHAARLNAMQTKNNMEVQDICARTHRYVDRTKRVTDPNNPSYVVNGMEIRDDPLSKPKPLPKQLPNFLLQTKDITGAAADTRFSSPFQRTEIRNIMNISDIDGACADSVKHSIVGSRRTNPLQPVYQSLDQGELLLPLIPPLVPPEVIKVPTMPARIRAKPGAGEAQAKESVSFSREGGTREHSAQQQSQHPSSHTSGGRDREGDLEPVLFTSQPSSGREGKPPSGRQNVGMGLNLPSSGFGGIAGGGGGLAPSSSARSGSFNYTSYSNTNLNALPYSATTAQSTAPGGWGGGGGSSAPASGRLSKRAQAALEADVALVKSLQ